MLFYVYVEKYYYFFAFILKKVVFLHPKNFTSENICVMKFWKQDPFGKAIWIKKLIIRVLGLLTHRRYRGFNKLHIQGTEHLLNLPSNNVLFVANHQTYFADVIAMYHVFNASLQGRIDSIENISYILNPKTNIYYIAAAETMRAGLLPKILAYAGAVTVDRTWRENGKAIKREVKTQDVDNIGVALNDGWVITFPQGTTTPWVPVRKGTGHLIKKYKPIVIPIVVDGFRRSFDKKGVVVKKKNVNQSLRIKPPLQIDYEDHSVEDIIEMVQYAIEQHPSFIKVEG